MSERKYKRLAPASEASSSRQVEASSSQAESPSKKRKSNVRSACDACRAKKTACDEKEPSCSACSRRRSQCVYPKQTKEKEQEEAARAVEFVHLLRDAPEEVALEALGRLRSGEPVAELLANLGDAASYAALAMGADFPSDPTGHGGFFQGHDDMGFEMDDYVDDSQML